MQRNARHMDPYTHQVQADDEQSQRRLMPTEKRAGSPNHGSPMSHATRLARQEILERRLITLEQEILRMAAALSTRETELTSLQRRLAMHRDDENMTANELRERMNAMRSQVQHLEQQRHSDWAEGLSDDLPPGYTPDDF